MQFGLTQVVAPTNYPVTLAEAKAFCRVEITDDDTLITSYLASATSFAETFCGRALCTQTLALTLDRWPADYTLRLPKPPIQSLTSIQYKDYSNVWQTISSSAYVFDQATARVTPTYGGVWPVQLPIVGSIKATYVAGYSLDGSSVPEQIKLAIKYLVSLWYDQRTPILTTGAVASAIPFAVEALLMQHQTGEIF